MIDLVCFIGERFELGFSKVYNINELNIIFGGDENTNNKALENKKTDILVSPERNAKKDNLHFRDSGLNQVLCKLAADNKVAIGFNLSDLLNSKERNVLLGRMRQNVELCRKYKIKMVLASFARNKYEQRNPRDMESLARVLGMNEKEIKEALNFKKKEINEVKLIR